MARRTETTDTSDERDRSGELRARDEPPDPAHERSAIAPPSLVLRSPRSPKSIDERDRERPVDAMLLAAERELIFASDPLAEELAARQLLALREIASEPEAGARHDASDVEHRALGEGDEVLRDDGRTVKVAFPATPAGVVEAALYELHRGEPRPLDEIARDPTAARWARGPGAATEGAARANDDAEPTAATAAERAVGLGARGTWETETRLLALRSKHARTIALLAKPLAERTGDEREVLRRARLDPTTRLELQALADAARRESGQRVAHAGGRALGLIGTVQRAQTSAYDPRRRRQAPWCGSFAAYVYARCGIRVGAGFASALRVPRTLATLPGAAAFYRPDTGDEASGEYQGRPHAGAKPYFASRVLFRARPAERPPGGAQDLALRGDPVALPSVAAVDIRPGDVCWKMHDSRDGHVMIVAAVSRREGGVDVVTIEGNVGDRVAARAHSIEIANGKIAGSIVGWGRPPELQQAPAPAASVSRTDSVRPMSQEASED